MKYKKKIILIIAFAILLVTIFILDLKDTHSYYLDTNALSLVSSKIGKFGSIEKSDIKKDAGDQLQDTAVFGLYRYYGTKDIVKNNYICFGTNDKDTCLGSPDTYMYRIIGITDNSTTNTDLGIPENSLKIIKASKYGENVSWNDSSYVTWDRASVNTTVLNTQFYNTISTTESGVNWKNIILSSHMWYIGDSTDFSATTEPTTYASSYNPIGLMYKSDYYNAGSQGTNNWLFFKNGWSTNKSESEWTMSRRDGKNVYSFDELYGFLESRPMSGGGEVRPVLYLIPGISLSGTGASNDPYLISIS